MQHFYFSVNVCHPFIFHFISALFQLTQTILIDLVKNNNTDLTLLNHFWISTWWRTDYLFCYELWQWSGHWSNIQPKFGHGLKRFISSVSVARQTEAPFSVSALHYLIGWMEGACEWDRGGVWGPSSHYYSEVGQKTRAAMLRTLASLSHSLSPALIHWSKSEMSLFPS